MMKAQTAMKNPQVQKGMKFASWLEAAKNRSCHSSVDTPIDGVDTRSESLKLFHENRVKCSSSGDLQQLEASRSLEEGFTDSNLLWRSTKNPKEWCFGGFLGLPKESFISLFDPFEDLFRGNWRHAMLSLSSVNGQTVPLSLVGDTPLEEIVESDSERGE
ncbi:hypothetical protein Taro_018300 [Colocasia esculenta]|uniref:Uncharacterized protein n=1 Tax=Colocasia esculenta TaxID=4460 RepID=A0A843UIC8_COLES|nr:hypothetical protein [Colocasia esculenta]